MNPEVDSGKGYGSILAARVEQVAKDRLADGVFVTVSSEKQDALSFFKKKGFTTQKACPDLYKPGSTEEFLFLNLPQRIAKRPAVEDPSDTETNKRIKKESTSESSTRTPHSTSSSAAAAAAVRILPPVSSSSRTYAPSSSSSYQGSVCRPNSYSAPQERTHASSSSSSYQGSVCRPNSHSAPQERTHSSTLGRQYIQQIQAGTKTYEGRINSGPFIPYQVGDKANWFAGDLQIETRITSKKVFNSFREMLTDIGYKNMLPTARSLDDAVNEYNKIPSYAERAQRSGVVAFGLELLPRSQGTNKHYGRA